MTNIKDMRALVTGASSGIGTHFARQLAERGAHVVITARRADRLEALATELREAHGVEVDVIAADLSEESAPAALFDRTEGSGKPIDILVNNAGFGTQDNFGDIPIETTKQQIALNMTSLTELTWRFLAPMKGRGRGWILNVASIGAWQPVPMYATYGAGKAYVRNFTEAISAEESGSGVVISCLCPGATRTEFMEAAGHELVPWQERFLLPADDCARYGLSSLFAGRRLAIHGLMNRIAMFMLRFVPRRLSTWFAAKTMGKP